MFKYIAILIACFSTLAFAEDFDSPRYEFQWQSVPVICGTTSEVQRYLDNNDFELEYVSVGREGAKADGAPAYWVAFYMNTNRTESISAITSPSGNETCMLYRSFDLRGTKTQTSL